MADLRRDAHLFRNLVVFEAATRCDNFTRAAESLGITRVAVSRQIAELEAELGCRLFVRAHRSIKLTAAGEQLAHSVNPALRSISKALDNQRASKGSQRITVTVTSAFATYWLMPRLADFSRSNPAIEVNLVVSDLYLDLDGENIDVAVRYMPASLTDASWRPLMREHIFPVYGANYSPRTSLKAPSDLLSERLLHLSGSYRPEAGWAHWFQTQNLPVPEERTGIYVNTYLNMLQAAVEGQGIALAGPPLIEDMLDAGTLVALKHTSPIERDSYYVRNRSPHSPSSQSFERWLFEKAKTRSASSGDRQPIPRSTQTGTS